MIYILRSYSYDESFVVAVTDCPFEAEKLKQEYLVKLKEKKARYTPKQIQEFYTRTDDNDYEKIKEDENLFIWCSNFYIEDYSNEIHIEEIKENTLICNNLND